MKFSAVDRVAEQLGELGDDHGQGDPGQVADPDGHRQQLGDEPEPGQAAGQHDGPDDQREQPGQRDALVGVGAGQRDDGGGDERADGAVGADDEDAAGPEQEVDEERDQRRVQTGDGRQAGELRVAHALGDEQGGEHDAGEQVAAQAGSALRQQGESRHEAPEPCRVHRPTLTPPSRPYPSALLMLRRLPETVLPFSDFSALPFLRSRELMSPTLHEEWALRSIAAAAATYGAAMLVPDMYA